ncbi:MAG: acetate--CoA ligase family protein [Verrucomicrobia bacterium]|nr:acetate--CoA ligase family protein [Verrucomicrobiota bacterium]
MLEHQSKKLLASFDLRFTEAVLVDTTAAAAAEAERAKTPVVLKAQVPFGGRGKAGAVKFAETAEQAHRAASELLGMDLRGQKVACISVEPKVAFAREFYVGIAWDTAAKLPVALLSVAGGVEVEASSSPQLAKRAFDPRVGLRAYEGREMAAQVGLAGRTLAGVGCVLAKLAQAFLDCDALVMEINPLVETADGTLLGLDARVEIDDDAAHRQRTRLALLGEIVPTFTGRKPTWLELEAQRIDAMDHRGVAGRVVEFAGDLALLIGGGGASLTVFDAIQRHGGRPANYCEVGGNPTEEKVAALTSLLVSKPGVRQMAVIMNVVNNTRADVMARGVLLGLARAGRKPSETLAVFRVPGSWEHEARQLLAGAGVEALGREVSLDAAAKLAVEKLTPHVA